MRKKFLMLVVCILIFVFSACEPAGTCMPPALLENVKEVQLIYYNNPTVKKISEGTEIVIPFNVGNMEIIEVLSEEKEKEILIYLQRVQFFFEDGEVDSPNGYAFRMVYEDGSYMVISFSPYAYSGIFNADGEVIAYYGYSAFNQSDCNEFFTKQLNEN